MNPHDQYIKRAISLAHRGIGKTKTNPMVGAVLVLRKMETDTVIGEGYHRGYGKPHAEVEAVRDAHRKGFKDFDNTILYINLEPCCHYGKTPPCTDLIIREKIPHVVFGTLDPFSEVAGKSVRILRKAGIKVEYGFLKNECYELNKTFFKTVKTGLPWITMKVAQTLDGKMADDSGQSKWISSEQSRKLVHRWRSEYDAVFVGAGTVIKDNPQLNVRLVKGRQPIRVILDGKMSIPATAKVFRKQEQHPTIVFTAIGSDHPKCVSLKKRGVTVISMPGKNFRIDLKKAFQLLIRDFQIASVLVEGGSELFGQLLNTRLADDVHAFIAPKLLGNGLSWIAGLKTHPIQRAIQLINVKTQIIEHDILVSGKIHY